MEIITEKTKSALLQKVEEAKDNYTQGYLRVMISYDWDTQKYIARLDNSILSLDMPIGIPVEQAYQICLTPSPN